jgi:hypothetical protein
MAIGGFYACDSTTSPGNPLDGSTSIDRFEITPSFVEFTLQEDGFKDTTITIELYTFIADRLDSDIPEYAISKRSSGSIVAEGELTFVDSCRFNFMAEANILTTTTSFEDYIINVFFKNNLQIYAQTGFSIKGFSNVAPQIISIENHNEVEIPSSGKTPIQFKAKVKDTDGQSTIRGVYMRLISRSTGEVSGSPFPLYDDGQINGTSGDQIAQDSIFTLTLEIASSNNPDFYDLKYYAIDKGGLVSDTLKSTLRIKE